MEPLSLAVASAGLLLTGGIAAACCRLSSLVSFTLATYLLVWAHVVLLTEALSGRTLVGRGTYALGELLLLAAALGAWQLLGRPRPPVAWVPVWRPVRRHPVVAALALAVVASFAYALFLVLTTPPNNGDSLTYHLTRAAAWLQHGGLYRIPLGSAAENEYPANGEIGILYTFAFLDGDAAAALTQLLAEGAAVLAVYGCARRLGYAAAPSAFAALLVATLPEIVLQSVTTQNDLLVASFVASAAYFIRSTNPAELALAAVAIGLALGTKLTAVFALPVLLVIALTSVRGRRLVVLGAASVSAFALLGSYAYLSNVVETGSPLGRLEGDPGLNRPDGTASGTISTVARYAYGFVDLSGFDIDPRHLRPIPGAARRLFSLLEIPTNPPESTVYPFGFAINQRANEDVSFFGPLGALLVIPLAIGFAIRWCISRREPAKAAHALALPLYLAAIGIGYSYSGQGRFFVTPVLLVMPLVASVYRHRVLTAAVAFIAAVSMLLTHASNELKPTGFRGTTPIWDLSRSVAQAVRTPVELEVMIDGVERLVPASARVGVVVGEHDFDYVLYGPSLDRTLVRLPRDAVLRAADRARLSWIYLGRFERVPRDDGKWRQVKLDAAGVLLARRSGRL